MLAIVAYLVGSVYVHDQNLTTCVYRTMDREYHYQEYDGRIRCPDVLLVDESDD